MHTKSINISSKVTSMWNNNSYELITVFMAQVRRSKKNKKKEKKKIGSNVKKDV